MKPEPLESLPPELTAYYADRRLMWWNFAWISVGNIGATAAGILSVLIALRLKSAGISEGGLGLLNSVNLWAVSILVMYFGWKSDHCVSRWGRRIPFLFLSLPFIVGTYLLFPLTHNKWLLIGLQLIQFYFMDMKMSTYPLLFYDCIPRDSLARMLSLSGILGIGVGFVSARWGMRLAEHHETLTFLTISVFLTLCTLVAGFTIKEPPIKNPATQRFSPFAPMRVGLRDRRMLVLMLAIASVSTFAILQQSWMIYHLRYVVGLTLPQIGDASAWALSVGALVAYPIAWVTDRWGSYRVLIGYWVLSIVAFGLSLRIANASDFLIFCILNSALNPAYAAADILLVKHCHPADIGSITSTNSFFRNAFRGITICASGFVIQCFHGDYTIAYKMGIVITTAGFLLFFIYRWLMQRPASPPGQPAQWELAGPAQSRIEHA